MKGGTTMETDVCSLLGAFSEILNLINPAMEYHHEQTAYLSYQIAKEMGLDGEDLLLVLHAALLHDIGDVVRQTPCTHNFMAEGGWEWHEGETREERQRIAKVGANMLRDLEAFHTVADIIAINQEPYDTASTDVDPEICLMAQVIHLADAVSAGLTWDVRILNQVKQIREAVEAFNGTEFCPEVVDAFLSISEKESMWMDLALNPNYMLSHLGPIQTVPLDRLVIFTSLISRVIDFRSPFTAMHSAGVAATAKALAGLAGMTEEECMMMEVAGNLHDIGKLRVPNSILEKPGKLTEEEFNVMKEHTYYTKMILQNVTGFEKIANWAAFHHEKLNGRGYPFHLVSEELDEGSRIMTVADIFSAITEVRPYRAGMSKEKAREVLIGNAERGEICKWAVELLIDHYDEVYEIRDQKSREVGKRYFESIGNPES